jgi:hypothetical protein
LRKSKEGIKTLLKKGTKTYPASESGTIVKFQEQVLNEIVRVIAYRIKELELNSGLKEDTLVLQ